MEMPVSRDAGIFLSTTNASGMDLSSDSCVRLSPGKHPFKNVSVPAGSEVAQPSTLVGMYDNCWSYAPQCEPESDMSRKRVKQPKTEAQIVAQESTIPSIAAKAFRDAYNVALSKGQSVLVVREGNLVRVSTAEAVVIRSVETYGTIKAGTRLKVKKSRQEELTPQLQA